MPRTATNYENTIIYKLCCKDPTITDVYVGSTTNFTKRKATHKNACNNPNNKGYNHYKYQFIRQNGGWDNWAMVEVKRIQCNDKNEAEREERAVIEELKASLNKQIPLKFNELGKEQYHKEHGGEQITCPHCNCQFRRDKKARHERSKKHQKAHIDALN